MSRGGTKKTKKRGALYSHSRDKGNGISKTGVGTGNVVGSRKSREVMSGDYLSGFHGWPNPNAARYLTYRRHGRFRVERGFGDRDYKNGLSVIL